MSKELVLFCNEDGKWELYDDTYDITIHCKSQQEQDEAMKLLHTVNQAVAISANNAANAIVEMCRAKIKNSCTDCTFAKDGGSRCALDVPDSWDI